MRTARIIAAALAGAAALALAPLPVATTPAPATQCMPFWTDDLPAGPADYVTPAPEGQPEDDAIGCWVIES